MERKDLRMIIGALRVYLHLPECRSLKDKRRILNSLKNKIRQSFNVGVCELGFNQTHQQTLLGIVCIGNSRTQVERLLDSVIKWEGYPREVEFLDFEREIL